MDDLISVHDLLNEVTSLLIVHRPDLLDALIISVLKSFKALLQFDKLVGEELVFLGILLVLGPSLRLLGIEQTGRYSQLAVVML